MAWDSEVGREATTRWLEDCRDVVLITHLIVAFQNDWVRIAEGVDHAEQLKHELLNYRWKVKLALETRPSRLGGKGTKTTSS